MTLGDLKVRPHFRFYVVVGLMVITLVTGMATGFYLFFRLFYVLSFVSVMSYCWVLFSVNNLRIKIERRTTQINVGEPVHETITLTNQNRFPKQALEVDELNDIPGATGGFVASLSGKTTGIWEMEIVPKKRGIYGLGPVSVSNTDPFGLLTARQLYGEKGNLTVLPEVHDLSLFELPDPYATGDSQVRKRSYDIAPHASSVRDYAPGDSLSRVHWNSTARLGRLISKEFDLGSAQEVWILLDLHHEYQAGVLEQSTDEYGASVAASIAAKYLKNGLPVGYIGYGDQRYFLTSETGTGQRHRILQLLAVGKSEGRTPIEVVLPEEALLWRHGSFLIIVTSSPSEYWVKAASDLVKRGVKVVAVMVDGQSFGGDMEISGTLEGLISAGVVTYLVKNGDDIPTVLNKRYLAHQSKTELFKEPMLKT